MNPRTPSVDTILAEAVEIADSAERQTFVEKCCAGDAALVRRVERLVADHFRAGGFLERPAAELMATSEFTLAPGSAEADSPVMTEGPAAVIGPYRLLEQIGEGGMGLVFVAEQQHPVRRRVALKIIKPGMDSRQVVARFEAERQALAMMDHINIAKIYDGGATPEGRPYFVMELVKGTPITDYCDRHNLSARQRLELFLDVCHAVQHAHQKGIIHRDLKPSNVLVEIHDVRPVVKVIDFGIAKATGQQLTDKTVYTALAQMVGTPMYMSPEQAGLSSLDVDTRSDVYSLGVLLYELLTGTTPFDSETLKKAGYDEMRRIIREEEPPSPSTRLSTMRQAALSTIAGKRGLEPRRLSQQLRGELDWIVMKSLEKDRNRRYESASALAADLQRYLDDEPVEACPPSLAYRLSKVARRHKTGAVITAIVSFSILGSSAFSALRYFDERQAREYADEQKLAAARNAERAERHAAEEGRQRVRADRRKAEAERQRDIARQNLYYADMRLAFVDLGLGNAGRARDTLLAHFPRHGDSDRRSWEWFYLLARSHEAVQAHYGHKGEVATVAWSPDGNNLASVSYDCSTRIWDVKTGKPVRTFAQGPTLKYGIDWSPDSRKLAWGSVSDESALRIWNRDTDQVAVLHGYRHSIWAVAWSHNGKYVATASIGFYDKGDEPGNVRIWDAETHESVAQFTLMYNVNSVSWSGDDTLIAAASGIDGPAIWDVSSQRLQPGIIMEGATFACWHPTEPRLAVGNGAGDCLIWDQRARQTTSRWKAHRGNVTDIKWNADGSKLMSAGYDGVVKIWDPVTGRECRSVAAHAGSARSVAWEPSGRQFASAGTDRVIRIWTADAHASPLVIDSGLSGSLNAAWNTQNSSLWLASADAGKVVAFDAETGNKDEEIPLLQNAAKRPALLGVIILRSDSSANAGARIQVSEIPSEQSLAAVVPTTALNTIGNGAVLSPDRTRIAYLSGWSVVIRDIAADRSVSGTVIAPCGIAWSPDGRLIAVVGRGDPNDDGYIMHAGWVHVFDAASGQRVRRYRIGAERVPGAAIAWSHDGRRLACADEQGLCEIWDWRSGRKLVSERIHSSRVNDLTWSTDDLRIASGGVSGQVHLWDAVTGQQLLALEPQKSGIRHIRWSPDNRKLAAVGEDGVIQIWDASDGYSLPERIFWRRMIEPQDWKEYERLIDDERWAEAAELLKEMYDHGLQDDAVIYRLALVKLKLDDEAGYRDVCRRMLALFADTEDKQEAYRTAWACALCPATLEDYGPAIALAQRAVDLSLDTRNPLRVRARDAEALGAILFRAGRYQEALRQLQAATDPSASRKPSAPRISYLLAMTHQKLRRTADARMWFERAEKEAENELADDSQAQTWDLKLTLDLVRAEAAAMLGQPSNRKGK